MAVFTALVADAIFCTAAMSIGPTYGFLFSTKVLKSSNAISSTTISFTARSTCDTYTVLSAKVSFALISTIITFTMLSAVLYVLFIKG